MSYEKSELKFDPRRTDLVVIELRVSLVPRI
jgi:hypothetical protein